MVEKQETMNEEKQFITYPTLSSNSKSSVSANCARLYAHTAIISIVQSYTRKCPSGRVRAYGSCLGNKPQHHMPRRPIMGVTLEGGSYVLFSPLGEKNHANSDATTMKMSPMTKLQLWKKGMH